MATARKRKRISRSNKKIMTMTSYVMIAAIIAFVIMAGLLFQHSVITEKNTEIRSLQKNLEDAIQANDSKEGKLVTNMNLQAIEAEARGYGMTEPVQEQYRREVITEGENHATETDGEKVKTWFENLF